MSKPSELLQLQLKFDLQRCKSIEWQHGRCVLIVKEWDLKDYESIAYSIVRRNRTVLRTQYHDGEGFTSTKQTHYKYLMSWNELKAMILELSKEH